MSAGTAYLFRKPRYAVTVLFEFFPDKMTYVHISTLYKYSDIRPGCRDKILICRSVGEVLFITTEASPNALQE